MSSGFSVAWLLGKWSWAGIKCLVTRRVAGEAMLMLLLLLSPSKEGMMRIKCEGGRTEGSRIFHGEIVFLVSCLRAEKHQNFPCSCI